MLPRTMPCSTGSLLLSLLFLLLTAVSAGAPRILVNGQPATLGEFTFPAQVKTVVFDNGLIRLSFGQGGNQLLLQSAMMNGTELLKGADGNSWYIDSGGGKAYLICDHVRIVRLTDILVEAAWVDTRSNPLQHEHHLIMSSDVAGIYAYNILHAVAATSISEVRFNTRWNRCLLNHAYNAERGHDGQQPSYAYLYTQQQIQVDRLID